MTKNNGDAMTKHSVSIHCEQVKKGEWKCTLRVDGEEAVKSIATTQTSAVRELQDFAKMRYGINPPVEKIRALSGRVRRAATTLGQHGKVLADVVTHEALTGRKPRRQDVSALVRALRHAGHPRTASQVLKFLAATEK